MAAPKQTDPQFKLRLTSKLRDQLRKAAEKSGRSMNAEIVHRLADSFHGKGVFQVPPYMLERLENIAGSQGRNVRFLIHETLMEKFPPPVPDEADVEEFMQRFSPLDQSQKLRLLKRIKQSLDEYNAKYTSDDES